MEKLVYLNRNVKEIHQSSFYNKVQSKQLNVRLKIEIGPFWIGRTFWGKRKIQQIVKYWRNH